MHMGNKEQGKALGKVKVPEFQSFIAHDRPRHEPELFAILRVAFLDILEPRRFLLLYFA